MPAHPFLLSVLLTSALLVIGFALRVRVRLLRVLYLPSSVIAGLLGFVVVQIMVRASWKSELVDSITNELRSWPGWLIAVVFAGLLLERASGKSFAEAVRRGARSAALAWIIILGQIAIGLLVYLLLVRPADASITPCFGQLLEVSWAGGHGSSAAMGQVYAALGFPQGRDLAFFLATVGLVWGVISGLVLVNVAIRRGWTYSAKTGGTSVPANAFNDPVPAAYAKTRTEVLDPMTLQIIILAAAFAVGFGLQSAFIAIGQWALSGVPNAEQSVQFLENVPLFLFTLLGGWLVSRVMQITRAADLIDPLSLQRLLGVAMDFLIVAAIATIRIDALQTFLLPVIAMIVLASAWSAFCLLVLARKLLPPAYWFELGLLNYGFSTANTPQGIMLLRIVDPDLRSGATEDYALAAPLSAPFVGGGVVTIVLMPLILQRTSPLIVLIVLIVAVMSLYIAGQWLSRRS